MIEHEVLEKHSNRMASEAFDRYREHKPVAFQVKPTDGFRRPKNTVPPSLFKVPTSDRILAPSQAQPSELDDVDYELVTMLEGS